MNTSDCPQAAAFFIAMTLLLRPNAALAAAARSFLSSDHSHDDIRAVGCKRLFGAPRHTGAMSTHLRTSPSQAPQGLPPRLLASPSLAALTPCQPAGPESLPYSLTIP